MILLLILTLFSGGLLAETGPLFMEDPCISPDGQTICFRYRNDLYLVPFTGGDARQITATPWNESAPLFLPDGSGIVYSANPDGRWNIWRMPEGGGDAEIVCREELSLEAVFPDGSALLASRNRPFADRELYRVPLDGSPTVLIAPYGDEFHAISPDGSSIVFGRRGKPYRERYQGSGNGELWRYDIDSGQYHRLTDTPLSERYPGFNRDGDLYYAASDGSVFQLMFAPRGNVDEARQLTDYSRWSVRDLTVAADAGVVVFEHFDSLGFYDPRNDTTGHIPVRIAQTSGPEPVRHQDIRDRFDRFTLSRDGKVLLFTWKFDLFAVPLHGGEVKQITTGQPGIDDFAIMNDGQTVFYTARGAGAPTLYRTSLANPAQSTPVPVADAETIEWIRNGADGSLLISHSLGEERYRIAVADSPWVEPVPVIDEYVRTSAEISPDGDWLAWGRFRARPWSYTLVFTNIDTGEEIEARTFMSYLSSPVWGTDVLLFSMNSNIIALDLAPRPDFEEDPWRTIIDPADTLEAEPGPIEIVPEGIENRFRTLVARPGSSRPLFVDADTLYYYQTDRNRISIRRCNICGQANDRVVHVLPPGVTSFETLRDSLDILYQSGKQLLLWDRGDEKTRPVEARYHYQWDEDLLLERLFDEVRVEFGRGFYDPDMHGVDWEALCESYRPYLERIRDKEGLDTIISELIGEVNASHTGFTPKTDSRLPRRDLAYLGAVPGMPDDCGVPLERVYRGSTLEKVWGIGDGAVILEVNGVRVGASQPLTPLLLDRQGERLELVIEYGGILRRVEIRGLSRGAQSDLFYEDWVARRRAKVDSLSGGRIGYLHVRRMYAPYYQRFEHELNTLCAGKDAVIVDVRFNSGGRVHDDILEALSRKPYGYTTRRYAGETEIPVPYRPWGRPVAVLINESSASDAEIFPIVFATLGMGTVIGMPTGGGVIGTVDYTLMDGSVMRMPRSGWFTADGVNMEGTGAVPHIQVEPTPEQIVTDTDVQLQKAVEVLMQEIASGIKK